MSTRRFLFAILLVPSLAACRNEGQALLREHVNNLRHIDPQARQKSAEALGRFGPNSAHTVPELVLATTDEHEGTRIAAVTAIGKIGPSASKTALAALLKAREDVSAPVRASAAVALASVAPRAHETELSLIQGLRDQDSQVRLDAVKSLGEIGYVGSEWRASAEEPDARVRDAVKRYGPSTLKNQSPKK